MGRLSRSPDRRTLSARPLLKSGARRTPVGVERTAVRATRKAGGLSMRERIISFFVVSAFAGPVGAMALADFAAGESLFVGLIGGTVAAWITSQSPRHS